jgi:hypothetical protein
LKICRERKEKDEKDVEVRIKELEERSVVSR